MKVANLIVYLCAVVMIILGVYSFIYLKDIYSGVIWPVFGIIIAILGYIRLK
ncbi:MULTISPECIES: hypothetical protein [Methanobacterium]|jgi:hypothetical protein|uniref:hypothetical protein n=1 Tax=Methanobacterium TaxID=2160 RepID=UPI000A4B32D7|nr:MULTISPECIES: hypothetical protein [Methanobacterium]